MKTICYLKKGMSVYAVQYVGECGRRRGKGKVTLKRGRVTCPGCKEKLRKRLHTVKLKSKWSSSSANPMQDIEDWIKEAVTLERKGLKGAIKINNKMRQAKKNQALSKEIAAGKERYLWMSFADPTKPKGQQFLGVIITKAMGPTDAMLKTHELGINPGGEIKMWEITEPNQKFVDRLMQKKELESEGLI